MSETSTPAIDIRAEIARIDRGRAATDRLREEVRQFAADAHKPNRDRFIAPIIAIGSIVAAVFSGMSLLLQLRGVR